MTGSSRHSGCVFSLPVLASCSTWSSEVVSQAGQESPSCSTVVLQVLKKNSSQIRLKKGLIIPSVKCIVYVQFYCTYIACLLEATTFFLDKLSHVIYTCMKAQFKKKINKKSRNNSWFTCAVPWQWMLIRAMQFVNIRSKLPTGFWHRTEHKTSGALEMLQRKGACRSSF